jgi:hypothetical protein
LLEIQKLYVFSENSGFVEAASRNLLLQYRHNLQPASPSGRHICIKPYAARWLAILQSIVYKVKKITLTSYFFAGQ